MCQIQALRYFWPGCAANLDLDRRRARTALVFRHHRNEIGRYEAGASNRG
jgi:hypothetical protein